MDRPKKSYEELEAELKRVKIKSSERKRNLQGLNKTLIIYKSLYTQYHNDAKRFRDERDALHKELEIIKNSKLYKLVKGML